MDQGVDTGSTPARRTYSLRAAETIPSQVEGLLVEPQPIRWKVAYFGSMFFLVDFGLNYYQGRPLFESLLVAAVAAPVSLLPWWVVYRFWGRDESIAAWWFGTFGLMIYSQGKPLGLLLKSLVSVVAFEVVLAILCAKIPRHPRMPERRVNPALGDADGRQ